MSLVPSRNKPLLISLLYLTLGLLWIFFSDRIMVFFTDDQSNDILWVSVVKGSAYVIFTAILLYLLIRNLYSEVNRGKRELQLLFANPSLGLFKLDSKGRFEYISDNALQLLGHRPESLVGKRLLDITPERVRRQDLQAGRDFLSIKNDTYSYEKQLLNRNGEEITLLLHGITLYDKKNRPKGFLVAFQNITDRVRTLRALELQNQKLAQIAYMQSHILRAPVARIMGLTNIIELEDPEWCQKNPELIKNIKVSAKELDRIIHGISAKTEAVSPR